MPKATFFRLPQEKRESLIAAAHRELARAPFAEVSINRIVKDAGISRGSFYQYFADKTDLIDHMTALYFESTARCARQCLAECGGDIFAAMSLLLERLADMAAANASLSRNLLMYLKARDCTPDFIDAERKTWAELMCACSPSDGASRLRGSTVRELEDSLSILLMTLRSAVASIALHPEGREEARRDFENKLAILKRGLENVAAEGGY